MRACKSLNMLRLQASLASTGRIMPNFVRMQKTCKSQSRSLDLSVSLFAWRHVGELQGPGWEMLLCGRALMASRAQGDQR